MYFIDTLLMPPLATRLLWVNWGGFAAGFLELEQNITYGLQAEALVDKLGGIKRFQSRHIAYERTDVAAASRDDPPGEPIGLGMSRRSIKGF
jgi:hypothetical protein